MEAASIRKLEEHKTVQEIHVRTEKALHQFDPPTLPGFPLPCSILETIHTKPAIAAFHPL